GAPGLRPRAPAPVPAGVRAQPRVRGRSAADRLRSDRVTAVAAGALPPDAAAPAARQGARDRHRLRLPDGAARAPRRSRLLDRTRARAVRTSTCRAGCAAHLERRAAGWRRHDRLDALRTL